jgi:tetratricopeptide (TPR) repeat protein
MQPSTHTSLDPTTNGRSTRPRRRRRTAALAAALLGLASLTSGPARADDGAADRAIAAYQHGLRRRPADPWTHYRLGDAYVQKFRATADPSWLTLAERALRRSLALDPAQASARRHLAYVLYTRHDFDDAAREAARAVAADPGDSHAWGVLGDAHLEVGRYAEAERAYRRMLETGDDLYAHARSAALPSLRGDVPGAVAALERALERGRAEGRPAEAVAWVEWQLGQEHWSRGDLPAAETAYRAALVTVPGYHRALAGLAQVLLARGRATKAVPLLEQAIAVIPQLDYVVALGDLHVRLGRPDAAERQYALAERIGQLSALNQALYNRELAWFYLDHDRRLDEALALARRELEIRQDVHAHDLMAWSLYKTGQPQAARAAMAEALRLGTRDARLFYHAGMIERQLGNPEGAAAYLRRALATNPHFHPHHAAEARRALEALEGAEASGSPSPRPEHPDAS